MQDVTPENGAKQDQSSTRVNVRLRPVERPDQPTTANFSTVAVAQGIAYLDFGFIEPALLGRIARTVQDGQSAPKSIDGQRVTRMAMPLEQLVGLHQQIQQVLVGLRDASQLKTSPSPH
ncbi:hypothetical protein W02_36520 [Nitrospira sp. KM1]|uniref:hypothetical protein n=1 Tax=Nitrospira sp. KM1 TaxID=1936990 RepID=UPI0013A7261E|nr:hypothetical protein [Nitrospira sp. KM1]BCA56512.1 hypothetical protein W02_36520 [Nitrospira sp. KM1]